MANETPLGPFVSNRPTEGWDEAMGSSHNRIRTYDLAARCCHGAFYAVGFLTTTIIFMAVLWILWCYFGLSIVQGQRRALVNYSLTTAKPQTSTPSNQSTPLESSLNTISKSVTTSSSFHRGASRGESQLKYNPDRKDISRGNSSWAKGDFASRNRAAPAAKDISVVPTVSPQQNSKSDDGKTKDAVPSLEIKDDGIQTRRVASSSDNRHSSDEPLPKDVLDKDNPLIPPMKERDPALRSNITRNGEASRDELRTSPREYPKPEVSLAAVRDEIQSSRRSDADTVSRVPNFEKDSPRPYVRERTKYDEDEERGSRSRYDIRDRERDRIRYSDDRYSKGDTKLYPEDGRGRIREERRPDERISSFEDDRYDDLPRRRGDGDRIRDSDDRYVYRDDIPRYMEDDPRYKPRDSRYEDRDEERYRARDEDRYRTRDDRIYRLRNEKIDRSRYEDRDILRTDDRDRPRIDGRHRLRDDDRDRPVISDRDSPIIRDRDRPIMVDRDRPIIDDRIISSIGERERSRIDDRDRSIIKERPIISDRDRSRDIDRDISRIDDRDISRTGDRDRSSIDERGRPRFDDRDRVKIDDRDIPLRIDDRKDVSRILEPDRSRIEDIIKADDKDLSRIDDRYRARVENVERPRVDDRYEMQDQDKDKSREYRRRGDDRDILRDEDDYRSRVETRRRTSEGKFIEERTQGTEYLERGRYIPRGEEDRYKDDTRTLKRDYLDPVIGRTDDLPPLERIPLPVRKSSNVRGDREGDEYDYPDRGSVRSNSDGLSRTSLPETRRRDRDDEYRRPSRYDDRDIISPSRVRDDTYSTSLDSRPRSEIPLPILSGSRNRDRYSEDSTRIRDTKYYEDEDRKRIPSSLEGSSRRSQGDDRREYKTRLPGERVETKYVERGEEVVLDRRSYASEEDDDYREKSNSRIGSYDGKTDTRLRGDDDEYEPRSRVDDEAEYSRRRKYDIDDDGEYSRRRKDDDEEFRRERPRGDYDTPKTQRRDSYDEYSRDGDRYEDDRTVRRYDDVPRNRDEMGLRKDERPLRNLDDRPSPALDRTYPLPKVDDAPTDVSRSTLRRDPIAVPSSGSRLPIGDRDLKFQDNRDRSPSDSARVPHRTVSSDTSDPARVAPDSGRREYLGGPRFEERPLNVKDVIQAASRHSHQTDSARKVSYPVFDPRVSNLTSPDVIRPSERRGSTILSRRKRRLGV